MAARSSKATTKSTPKKTPATPKATKPVVTAKKTAARPVAAKTTPKSATKSKHTTSKPRHTSVAKKPSYRIIGLQRDTQPFFSFSFTKDTLYWLIISLAVLALGLWVLHLESQIQAIYDQIDQNNAMYDTATDMQLRTRSQASPAPSPAQ